MADVASLIRRGEVLAAYDIAHAALEAGQASLEIANTAVLCLARANAVDFARSEYVRLGLDKVRDDPATIALGARLLKDVALAARGARRAAFARASTRRYGELVSRFGGFYGAVNAATMTLVAGDRARARALAARALLLPTPSDLTGEEAYYEVAGRAEACVLAGDDVAAQAMMTAALAHAPLSFSAHASTLRQLEIICRETGADEAWLASFRPPVCAHFTGHILDAVGQGALDAPDRLRRDVDRLLRDHRVGFAYGGLAAGADIVFAEAVLEAGAELHVVMPVNRESFVATSLAPFGESWIPRFERCLGLAASVRYASRDPYLGDDRVFAYASQFAMGCAVLRAQTLSTTAVQLAVWDGHAAAGPAGVAIDLAYWSAGGRRQAVIDCVRPPPSPRPDASQSRDENPSPTQRAMKAMLFADVKGFGALRDDQIPSFFEVVMGQMARVIAALDAPPCHLETWGDGLFLVFDRPVDAAVAALTLLEAHRGLDLRATGLPRNMGLRIGGHYGPVHLRTNPLTGAPAVVGTHVVVAARIEPDVAPGSAYVSEALAGALATFHGDRFRCGYVGRTRGRKGFPPTPIFNLSRA